MIKITNSIRPVSLVLICFAFTALYGCSTSVEKKPITPKKTVPVEQPIVKDLAITLSAEELLSKASKEKNQQAITYLLQAASKYLEQQQTPEALHISVQLAKLDLNRGQANLNWLNMTEALFLLDDIDVAADTISYIETTNPNDRQLLLTAKIEVAQGLLVKGLVSYLDYYQQYPITEKTQAEELQLLFAQLTPRQQNVLATKQAHDLSGWLSYVALVETYSDQSTVLTNKFTQWQEVNPRHSANLLIDDVNNHLAGVKTQQPPQNIVVLIPLSGREESLGKTLQAGIFSAYLKQTNMLENSPEIRFIDTNAKPMQEIVAQLHDINPDLVIGPLLKQHVKSYLKTNIIEDELIEHTINTSQLLPNKTQLQSNEQNSNDAIVPIATDKAHSWISLLLNLPEQLELHTGQFALSMLPEDEASQAAFSLSQKSYVNALVLSQNTAIGKRMAESFAQQWQKQTNTVANIIYYPTGKNMQIAVKKSLDVNLSDERIFHMRNRIKENLKSEARNRRDIDMIYMFASPDQARLLKPYVDVNISPFAEAIPIYASSRSHNIDSNRNTRRDLTGLTFTEIPWLLNGKQVNSDLAQEARQVWPNRSSQLERIYAMGIDSWQLINKITLMEQIPLIRHKGETGVLQMDEHGIISRSLSWGKYRSSRVQSVAME